MKNLKILLLIPLMLLSAFFIVPFAAHGAGTVSINGGNPIIALSSATSVSVPINIAGADAMNGFDVQVLADSSILSGKSISLTGSVLPSAAIVVECINGILIVGPTCAPQDGPGVVHIAAVQTGSLTTPPTTGLLVTITYDIKGSTASIPVTFNTGCSGTSVANTCVTISNGTTTPVSVTVQNTTFGNLVDFTMTPAFSAVSGTSSVSDKISYASEGGFGDILSESYTSTPAGLTCTFASGSVDLLSFTTGSDTITCTGSAGDYTVVVTATGSLTGRTHSVTIHVHIGPAGFSISASPSSLTINRGDSKTSTLTVTGFSGFSGTVTITASGPAGITGSAPSVSLTSDASGYSTASSTLTVHVASTVATGTYTLTVTGMSGTLSASTSLTITVPGQDFTFSAVPNAVTVPRGGSVASTLVLSSQGNFACTASFSASIVPVPASIDPGTGVTNNIAPAFSPSTIVVPAGGTVQVFFFAATQKHLSSSQPTDTATGNYTATLTATCGGISHTLVITFNVIDFSLGPTYCDGPTPIETTVNANFDPVFVGAKCDAIAITQQTHISTTLWMQVNSLGGLQTNGNNGNGIGAVNPQVPARGQFIPELGFSVCLLPTFFANGTQVPYPYLRANGPIIRAGTGSGCRFDAAAYPFDIGVPNPVKNVDFFAVTANALNHTAIGAYTVNVCGVYGSLVNCGKLTFNVIQAPQISGLHWTHSVSVVAGGLATFTISMFNPSSVPLYMQAMVHGVSDTGTRSFTEFSRIVLVAPGATVTVTVTHRFVAADVGHTFSFTVTILAGLQPNALTAQGTLVSNNGNEDFDDSNQSSGSIVVRR